MSEDENIHGIVRRAAEGDENAWNYLIDKYSSLLWWTARGFRLTNEQAADVVQVTWLRLVENIGRIRDPERLSAWLLTTARRRCIDELNAAGRERPLDDHHLDVASHEDGPEECALRHEPREAVRKALRRLPQSQQRMLLLLAASPPLSYQEISTRLGIPIGSIGPSRGRALRRLHVELGTHHPGVFDDSRSPMSA
ncbi:MAG TPA: sigma-70 family RNA polymerase sigma factor [Kribbella sp.]|uniref:RNA polymerase sigma factor n=1 Tax=Kribbella sp. TaxID=1871183 RepID=UPI002D76E3C3|nr:sigma-70 family RNA polymerase sigma factor [Kribbella sp.]HET6298480.1 sigma-70 family RNA polymerase sigma factor [Kribbella sp.]